MSTTKKRLAHSELLQLKRWNTPTIYNGWEKITARDSVRECFNLEQTHDFMPNMGPMVGYAITVVIEPGNAEHPKTRPDAWHRYLEYMAVIPGPKIVVVQDLAKPDTYGAFWGEVNSNIHRALGCVGTIIDGAIRDVDEMNNAGFKALARRLCVGHASSMPIKWNCDVDVFGCKIEPGQLIHADKHGFLAVPREDEQGILEAARFMDQNECDTLIATARSTTGKPVDEILKDYREAATAFANSARTRFGRDRE